MIHSTISHKATSKHLSLQPFKIWTFWKCPSLTNYCTYMVIFTVVLFLRISPRNNIHFNIWLFIVMKTSQKSRNWAIANIPTWSKITKMSVREIYGIYSTHTELQKYFASIGCCFVGKQKASFWIIILDDPCLWHALLAWFFFLSLLFFSSAISNTRFNKNELLLHLPQ